MAKKCQKLTGLLALTKTEKVGIIKATNRNK